VFYELSEFALAAGMVAEPQVHQASCEAVRSLDDAALAGVTHVLAGSESVRDRLATFSGRSRGVSVFHAGPVVDRGDARPAGREALVLCVSRHDFPKRTELFVHAAHLLRGVRAVAVGAGGRLGFVQQLDERFRREGAPAELDARELWLNVAPWVEPRPDQHEGAITFRTAVDTDEVSRLMASACCLVAPALLEDYGLTAIEAMRHGLPVVTCTDSGHLREFVEHGVTGLVVEPDGRAIATAVQSLADDPRWARELGLAARERSAAYTWERALEEFDSGMDEALS
jgi:glycosyltransferase involved in cell wall biosynthesis